MGNIHAQIGRIDYLTLINKTKAATIINMNTVNQIPEEAIFVSDSQDVIEIKNIVGEKAEPYDSFFVIVGDGEYKAVWGMVGIVPYLSKLVSKIL